MSTNEIQYEVSTGEWKDVKCIGPCSRCHKYGDLGVDEDWDLPKSMSATYQIAVCQDCHEVIRV